MTIFQDNKGNMIEIAKIPLIADYRNLDINLQTKGVAISRDRKYFVILDSSVTEMKEYTSVSDGEHSSGMNVTIKFNDSLNLFGSIREWFKHIMNKVSEVI